MKVIAKRGDNYLLVSTRTVDGMEWGRIWNVRQNEMSGEVLVASAARFGYWEAYTGPQPESYEGIRMMGVPVKGG
jgi:hypothetical protein